jgi:hypothetical protein
MFVPKVDAYGGTEITESMIKAHIFKESIYVRGKFETVFAPKRVIHMKGSTVSLAGGFDHKGASEILFATTMASSGGVEVTMHCIARVLTKIFW